MTLKRLLYKSSENDGNVFKQGLDAWHSGALLCSPDQIGWPQFALFLEALWCIILKVHLLLLIKYVRETHIKANMTYEKNKSSKCITNLSWLNLTCIF